MTKANPMAMEREHVRSAEQRYPDLFAFIDAAIDYFSDVIDTGALPAPKSRLQLVRTCAVMRAYNLLKSIRQLLATDHWENAAILMRSLFELDLNMEEMERDPAKADEHAERFVRFEVLQKYLRRRAEADYEVHTGRKSGRDPKLIEIEKSLPRFFSEWAVTRKNGTIKWRTSWCGKNVRSFARRAVHRSDWDNMKMYMRSDLAWCIVAQSAFYPHFNK